MRTIPKTQRDRMAMNPFMHTCARKAIFDDHECERDPIRPFQAVEWEHAFQHAGSQINEDWAIIGSCFWAHRGVGLDKEKNQYIALLRATPADLEKYPRKDWHQIFAYLTGKLYEQIRFYDLVKHGPESDCMVDDCWMCSVIDEWL